MAVRPVQGRGGVREEGKDGVVESPEAGKKSLNSPRQEIRRMWEKMPEGLYLLPLWCLSLPILSSLCHSNTLNDTHRLSEF
jgi:hypothetical protein